MTGCRRAAFNKVNTPMAAANLIFYFLVIIPSAIIHEYAHGFMAELLGDKTARYAGRLTLNPIAHIDLFGTILMPLFLALASGGSFMFAYAKPVPYNPYNLRNQRYGPALVGLAGPVANFLLALAFAIVIRLMPLTSESLITMASLLSTIVYANLILMVFNLVPIAPLDGSKILYALLPPATSQRLQMFYARYGFFILIFFVFVLFDLLQPIINLLFNLLV